MSQLRDVAIVGAGLLGLAAGRALTARGLDVVLLEQAEIGHQGGGSKGSCRIFRLGYPDPVYVAAARQAGELWRQLEDESGRTLLLPAPHLTFGTGLRAVQDAMNQAGAPCELLSAAAAAERFPAIRTDGPALLEPESCVTAADQALAALAARVAEIRTGVQVASLADDGRQVTLHTSGGPLTARVAIVAAGPWSGLLLAALACTCHPGRRSSRSATSVRPTPAARRRPSSSATARRPRTGCRYRDLPCTRSGSIPAVRLPIRTPASRPPMPSLSRGCLMSPAVSCPATTRYLPRPSAASTTAPRMRASSWTGSATW